MKWPLEDAAAGPLQALLTTAPGGTAPSPIDPSLSHPLHATIADIITPAPTPTEFSDAATISETPSTVSAAINTTKAESSIPNDPPRDPQPPTVNSLPSASSPPPAITTPTSCAPDVKEDSSDNAAVLPSKPATVMDPEVPEFTPLQSGLDPAQPEFIPSASQTETVSSAVLSGVYMRFYCNLTPSNPQLISLQLCLIFQL